MGKFILVLCLLLFEFGVFAQTTIRGKVQTKNNEAIPGANVYFKNTFEGSTTDDKGAFEMETALQDSQVFVVSFLGYKTSEQLLVLKNGVLEISIVLIEDNTQLNVVTVVASQFEASDEKKSVVLGKLDVSSNPNSFADIYAAFNSLPGTSIAADEGGLMVRGGEQYETKTFVDGLLVESPFTAKMPNVPVRGRFSPMLFKGIVFNTGGYSAEYGQALSSALILNSVAMPPKSETSIAVYSCALSFSTTKKWNKSAITSITDYSNLKPYYSLTKSNIKWDKEPESLSQTLVFRQKINSTGMLKVLSSYMYENGGLYYQNLNSDGEDLIKLKKHNLFTIASYLGELNKNWIIYAGTSINVESSNTGININSMKENKLANEFKFTLTNEVSNKFNIKFGANLFNQQNKRQYIQLQDNISYHWNYNNQIYSAFSETEIKPVNRVAVRLGLRYEYLSLKQKGYLSPRISIAYQAFKNSQFSFAYGTFTQIPGDEFLLFNKKLDPERAEHFIVNYQINMNSRIFRIEAYYKNYKNLVKFDSLYAIDADAYNNLGNGYARGIDVFFKDSKTIKNGDFWISYSLMDSRRNYKDFRYSFTPNFVSKHNLTIQYKHYLSKLDVYTGFSYSFASGRPYVNPNISLDKQQYTGQYHNLSLNIFHFDKLFGKFIMYHFQVSNVLGTKQIFGYRYSNKLNEDGVYQAYPIESASKRLFVFGVYLNLQGQPEM